MKFVFALVVLVFAVVAVNVSLFKILCIKFEAFRLYLIIDGLAANLTD